MKRTSLYGDIPLNPRTTEESKIVASKWGATVDPYLPEIPNVESENEQCRESYFNITAERILFRKKLLGLPVDENLVTDANIAAAHPFGEARPTFGELAVPSVRLAAAFVPLTSDEMDETLRPVMARLYCVSGLSGRYTSPFSEGLQDAGIQNYNWFVAGVKDDVLEMGISGRSWLLAANLLMRIVEENDIATARNLINNFVVTGNVEDGKILHVTIGKKPELDKYEFRNFKWIIPMKNANEMITVPVRRIEKPATLEEAYQLIETMQNTLTRGLNEIANMPIRGAKGLPDKNALSDMLAKGADPCAAIGGQSPWGRYRENLYASAGNTPMDMLTLEDASRLDRIFSYYGSIPQFFFMLAHSGQSELLKNLRAGGFDINAIDYEGETALDFAETMNDSHAKELLVECGATKRGRFLPGSSMFARALNSLRTGADWGKKKAEQWICEALDNGLDPNETFITFPEEGETRQGRFYMVEISPNDSIIVPEDDTLLSYGDRLTYDFIYAFYETTMLLEALYAGSSEIVEKCLSKGIRSDVEIRVKYGNEVLTESGKFIDVSPAKLVLSKERPQPYLLINFIHYFNERNEFPNRKLADRVLKYFSENTTKSNG